ncbi:hypothetical protein [Fontivita pretiosa]|uniref:hypothetical protein n=1 Tax=Fontivita pretiosa TaxID=2989684 RepID=UPI003D18655D
MAYLSFVAEEMLSDDALVQLTLDFAARFPRLAPQEIGLKPNTVKVDPRTLKAALTPERLDDGWHWRRRKPDVRGCRSRFRSEGDEHEYLSIDLDHVEQQELLEVAEWYAQRVRLAYAHIHVLSEPEAQHAAARGLAFLGISPQAHKDPQAWSYYPRNLNELCNGIPDLCWVTVFGPMYVRHFGRDRLLSAPAPVVREIATDTILLQLSHSYTEVATDWEKFNATREAVIDHLGRECFNRVRTPSDPPPSGQRDARLVDVDPRFIPRELMPRRQKFLAAASTPPEALPPPLTSLEEMLAHVGRLKVITIMGSRVLIDKERKEMIGFADPKLAEEWIDKLIAAGVEAQGTSQR